MLKQSHDLAPSWGVISNTETKDRTKTVHACAVKPHLYPCVVRPVMSVTAHGAGCHQPTIKLPTGYTTNRINEHTTQHPATRALQTGGLRQRRSASLASPLRSGARRDAWMRTDWTRCVVATVSIVRCDVQCSPSRLLGHRFLRRLKGKQSPGLTTHPGEGGGLDTELALMLANTQPKCYYLLTRAGTVEVMCMRENKEKKNTTKFCFRNDIHALPYPNRLLF